MERRKIERYQPYAVDWRFLPEPALKAKDFIRHYLTVTVNGAAGLPILRPLWAETIGRRTILTIVAANKLFVHVPKSGGTSISKHLYGRNLPHYTADFYLKTFPEALKGIPSFAILRDPVERTVSAYKFLKTGGTPVVAADRYQVSRLGGLDSFETFVDYLHTNRTRLLSLINTLHPQSHFICDKGGRVLVNRLYCMQGSRGFPSELGAWLGAASLPRLNVSEPTSVHVSMQARRKLLEIYPLDRQLFEAVSARGGFARPTDLDPPPPPQTPKEACDPAGSSEIGRPKLLRSVV